MKSILCVLLFVFSGSSSIGQGKKASLPILKAAIILRIVELEENIAKSQKELSIYVLGAPQLAEALQGLAGKQVGVTKLGRVFSGEELPEDRPGIMFVGTSRRINEVTRYTRKNKVLSITDRADVFQRGISVSILTERGRPKISLNPTASVEEGLNWELDFRMFRNMVLEFRKLD